MLSGKPPFTGNCRQNCDWERGGSCRQCQSILWHSILDANYSFPEEDWSHISLEAKDLIAHLLVKDASKRYTADSVLNHPWLKIASYNRLNTPNVLTRERTNHRLSTFTSEAMAYSRIISERQNSQDNGRGETIVERWSTPPSFGLSPPGKSNLAKRRSLKIKSKPIDLSITEALTPQNESALVNFGSGLIVTTSGFLRSPNATPVQSPSSISTQTPHGSVIRLHLEQAHVSSEIGLLSHHTPTESAAHTPVNTPRAEAVVSLGYNRDERTSPSRKKLQLQVS